MGIMSFLGGNSKSLGKIINAGLAGADKLVFTQEERADYDRELQKMHLEFIRMSANESTTRSITRRLICLPIVYTWLFLILVDVFAGALGRSIASVTAGVEQLQPVAMLAISFYVGRHIVGAFSGVKK